MADHPLELMYDVVTHALREVAGEQDTTVYSKYLLSISIKF